VRSLLQLLQLGVRRQSPTAAAAAAAVLRGDADAAAKHGRLSRAAS